MVTGVGKYKHITPRLKILCWIHSKVSIMAFKRLDDLAPNYLCDFLEWYRLSRCLRSEDNCGSIVWNKLPIKIREQTPLNKSSKLLKNDCFN